MIEKFNKILDESIKEAQQKINVLDKNYTHVWVDFNTLANIDNSLLNNVNTENDDEENEKSKNDFYLKSAMDKDERMFKLNTFIESGEITELSKAAEILNVSKKTIINYLNELNKTLIDDNGQVIGNNQNKADNKNKKPTDKYIKYYNGNPLDGAQEITKKEHMQRVKEFKLQSKRIKEGL